jgi:hypothetical protein
LAGTLSTTTQTELLQLLDIYLVELLTIGIDRKAPAAGRALRSLMHRRSIQGGEQSAMATKKEGILFPWQHGTGAQPSYVEELDGESCCITAISESLKR